MIRIGGIAALLLCCPGCYTFSSADLASVPTGAEIRIYLSSQGMARLAEAEGQGLIDDTGPVLTGTLTERHDDAVSILIPVTRRQVGFMQEPLGQRMTLPVATIVTTERKRLDALWTTAAVVAGTGAVGAFIALIIRGARHSEAPAYDYPVDLVPRPVTTRIFTLRTPDS